MESYNDMKSRHQKEIGALPIHYVFSEQRLVKAMEEFGLSIDDAHAVCRSAIGFVCKDEDSAVMSDNFKRIEQEMKEGIILDTTGEGFIYEMFCYELVERGYFNTGSLQETLDHFGLTQEDIDKSPPLTHGLSRAIATIEKTLNCKSNQEISNNE